MASLSPFTAILGDRHAAHLLRRSTFVLNKSRIKTFATMTASSALDELMKPATLKNEQPIDLTTGQPWINNGTATTTDQTRLRRYVRNWVLNEMRYDETIHSRMLFFLHKIWVTNFADSTSERFFDYLALLRHYTTGSYKELAKKMTLDMLMLVYLNNTSNNKTAPNENYAREFLELFTIGKGTQIAPGNYTNYTEEDVIQGAKLLTGFKTSTRGTELDPDTGLPRGRAVYNQHNIEPKKFSAAFYNAIIQPATNAVDMFRELNDYVEMVFAQQETARLYCRRLYRYFVRRNISDEIETDIIRPLAILLIEKNYDTDPVIRTLLGSQHFFDQDDSDAKDEIIGGLIKSPLELFLQTTNYFNLQWQDFKTETDALYRHLDSLVCNVILDQGGMLFFAPSDVAGYSPYYQDDGYDLLWFTGNTIISRYKLGAMLISGRSFLNNTGRIGAKIDLAAFIKDSGNFSDPGDAAVLVREFADGLIAESIDENRKSYFLNIFLDDVKPEDWTYEWNNYLSTGDSSEVKIGLERLFENILSSQEYQNL